MSRPTGKGPAAANGHQDIETSNDRISRPVKKGTPANGHLDPEKIDDPLMITEEERATFREFLKNRKAALTAILIRDRIAHAAKVSRMEVMEDAQALSQYLKEIDPDDAITVEATALVASTQKLIMGILPRDESTSSGEMDNPYNADTPVAAEARLEAAHRIERAAHEIGKALAMRELDRGNVSQRRVSTLLGVAQMTVNRWYRTYSQLDDGPTAQSER